MLGKALLGDLSCMWTDLVKTVVVSILCVLILSCLRLAETRQSYNFPGVIGSSGINFALSSLV